jgi:hypothetical protein
MGSLKSPWAASINYRGEALSVCLIFLGLERLLGGGVPSPTFF